MTLLYGRFKTKSFLGNFKERLLIEFVERCRAFEGVHGCDALVVQVADLESGAVKMGVRLALLWSLLAVLFFGLAGQASKDDPEREPSQTQTHAAERREGQGISHWKDILMC